MEILIYLVIVGVSIIIGIFLDRILTINTRKEHKQIKKQAFTDQLTGKGNRHKFVEDMENLISKKKKFAVCFMDLDGFKHVNDTMGHDAGDMLLIELGKKLDENLPKTSESYRLGGDEFAILIENVNTVEEITKILDNLKIGLTKPIVISGVKIVLEYSLGVSIYPTDATNRSELMTYADDAMYYIKEHGKNDYYFHNDVLKAKLENKKKMEINLKIAVEQKQFVIEYTPRIDVKNRGVCLEANIIWLHPVLGKIEQEYFIKQAEEMGLITILDEYVIKNVCEKQIELINKGFKDVTMFVNICNAHINRHDFIDKLTLSISEYKIPKNSLELCFTQKLNPKDLNNYKYFVEKMKSINVSVSMSNLELRLDTLRMFKEIEIKGIKLDAAYSKGGGNFNENVILDIVNVCKDLDYVVEIVGIENENQLRNILSTKVDFIQGNYISKSLNKEDVEEYVKNNTSVLKKVYKIIDEVNEKR